MHGLRREIEMNLEEKYPSLKGKVEWKQLEGKDNGYGAFINMTDIEENCQDNQKVKETIKKICINEWENCGNRLLKELGLK